MVLSFFPILLTVLLVCWSVALSMEAAAKDAGVSSHSTGENSQINKVETKKFKTCKHCGKKNHDHSKCYFKDAKCNFCEKKAI